MDAPCLRPSAIPEQESVQGDEVHGRHERLGDGKKLHADDEHQDVVHGPVADEERQPPVAGHGGRQKHPRRHHDQPQKAGGPERLKNQRRGLAQHLGVLAEDRQNGHAVGDERGGELPFQDGGGQGGEPAGKN